MIAKNNEIAQEKSFKSTWWYQRTFPMPKGSNNKLKFQWIGIRATIWLNGKLLGVHEGMFSGPEYDIQPIVQAENRLVIKLDPVPFVASTGELNNMFAPGRINVSWMYTVTNAIESGFTYSYIPALGIAGPVKIESQPVVKVQDPFVACLSAENAKSGVVDLSATLVGIVPSWSGTLYANITPDNFAGNDHKFSYKVKSKPADQKIHLRFTIPDPQLWWPLDHGKPNLYKLELNFVPDAGGIADRREITFGIRSVEARPTAGGPNPTRYNYQIVINGKPIFCKGANWIGLSTLDFSRARYDRYLSICRDEHMAMIRAWGGGAFPESDIFYDLCNRYGIMVYQDWPGHWNNQTPDPTHTAMIYGKKRIMGLPYDIMEQTVRQNMLRIRNNPCLVMYSGGNEGIDPKDDVIRMEGRYATELGGTRPYHRQESWQVAWGGSVHNYDMMYSGASMDDALKFDMGSFIGEFGLESMPNYESVIRYLPENERNVWPVTDRNSSFVWHTQDPLRVDDLAIMKRVSAPFMAKDTMKDFIWGTQMAQATLIRHVCDRARASFPNVGGVLRWDTSNVYTESCQSTLDWYGNLKLSHWFAKETYASLHATLVTQSVNYYDASFNLPVFLFDDSDALRGSGWEVKVRAFDADLNLIKTTDYPGKDSLPTNGLQKLGDFTLTPEQTKTTPLMIVCEVRKNGVPQDRTYDWYNYERKPGCILNLAGTTVYASIDEKKITITNTGKKPAVGVHLDVTTPQCDVFTADDGYLWLDVDESKVITVNSVSGVTVDWWNKMP
jgi:beta-mannosidase